MVIVNNYQSDDMKLMNDEFSNEEGCESLFDILTPECFAEFLEGSLEPV